MERLRHNNPALRAAACALMILLCLPFLPAPYGAPGQSATQAWALDAPSKTARVIPAGGAPQPWRNGSQASPVPVEIGDEIEYRIRFETDDDDWSTPRYDMLFVLDWSASMNAGYGTDIFDQSEKSRILAKAAIFGTCRQLVAQYPDSRVAIMGLNSASSNSGNPALSNIQVDTDFADARDYVRVVENAFRTTAIDFNNDDNAMFLRMARDKLRNDTSQVYGGAGGVRSKRVLGRADTSRIPIIVHISDYEIADPPNPSGNVGGFWRDDDPSYTEQQKAQSLNAQVRAFRRDYRRGIYLAVRVDHFRHYDGSDNRFASPAWDSLLEDTVSLGGANWGKRVINLNNYRRQQDILCDLITDAADMPLHTASVTDLLPEGLAYVSSDPPAGSVRDSGGRAYVRWRLRDLGAGVHEVRVRARVTREGVFANEADVAIDGGASVSTNRTWHEAASQEPPDEDVTPLLHLRQVAVPGSAGDIQESPQQGYLTLGYDGGGTPGMAWETGLTAPAGRGDGNGLSGVPFATAAAITMTGQTKVLRLRCLTPQWYQYLGYAMTAAEPDTPRSPPHNLFMLEHGDAEADYGDADEFWITFYIRPLSEAPAPYTWDARTNALGRIEH